MEAGREWSWALKIKPDHKEAGEYMAQARAYALRDLADLDPGQPDAASLQQSYKSGVEHFMALRFKEALGFFNQAKARRPTHVVLGQLVELTRRRQREYADSFLAKGKLAFDAGDFVEGIAQWRLGLKEVPDDPQIKAALEGIAPKVHEQVDAWYAEASELFNRSQNKEAVALFDKVLALDSSHAFAKKKREEAVE